MSDVIVTARRVRGSPLRQRDGTVESSIISAEEMARRPASNVVEAVSILPGVSTYADMGLGQAATGSPEYITVRGFDAGYNAYELNGVRVPQSDPNSRALSLKMLPPFGLQSVAVVKAPNAADDGDAIGGVVDIHTPSAFDYGRPLTRVTLQGELSDLAVGRGFDGDGGTIQIELARRSAADRLGVYATGYFGKTHSVGEAGEVGDWIPTEQSQSGMTDFSKVSSLSADEYKYDFYTNTIEDYGGNLTLDYRGPAQTLYVRTIAAHYDDQGVDSGANVRQGLANTGVNAAGQPMDYWGRPVGPGLPGDPAYAPQQVSLNPGGGLYDASGVYNPYGVYSGRYFQLRDQQSELYTVQVGGATDLGRVSIVYEGSYGFARQARPDYVEGSSYGLPIADTHFTVNWLNGYTPSFVFSAPGAQAALFSQSDNALWKFQGTDSASTDQSYSGKLVASYFTGYNVLSSLQFGLAYSSAYRTQYFHDLTGDGGGNLTIPNAQGYATPYFNPAGPTVNNQPGKNISGSFLGYPGLYRVFSRGAYVDAIVPLEYQSIYAIDPTTGKDVYPNPGAYTLNDYNTGAAWSAEDIYSGYLLLDLNMGGLHAYPGLRYEETTLDATYWAADATVPGFATVTRSYGELLPSVDIVYQPDPVFLYRASVRRSFSRPAVGLLAGPSTITRDSGSGAILSVTESNPDLAPTTAMNYDLSAEYHGLPGSLFEAALYRKTLHQFIYASSVTGGLPQAPTASTIVDGVTYDIPENGGNGYLNGLELNSRVRLPELSPPLDGIGLGGNVTLEHSEGDSGRADHFGRQTWLPRAPELIYNLDAFYQSPQFWFDLAYQYTGLQLENLTSNNLDNFLQPTRFLNLRIGGLVVGAEVSVTVKNLTDGPVFWKTLGKSTRYLGTQDGDGNGSYVLTGRVFGLTVSRSW